MTQPAPGAAWPERVFDAAVLRGLDARARREIADAGALVSLEPGQVLYRAGDPAESFFVIAGGKVALRAVRRGDDGESDLRAAMPGDSFGEEATVPTARRATAIAEERALVAEIPVHVFRRAAGRSGSAEVAEQLERTLRRSATRDLLRTLALSRDLPERDVDSLLDAVRYHRFERGDAVYRHGDPAAELWLVGDGMVQIQSDDGDRLHVRAYLARGDFFGDAEITDGTRRAATAVASGASLLLAIPAPVLRDIAGKNPELLPRLRRVAADQRAAQQAIVGPAAAHHTQHVFRDLYRLQVARSLLTIDLDTCVRCGHCAWACAELYGVARLVRRGDKVVTRVDVGPTAPLPAPKLGGPLGALLEGRSADPRLVPQTLMLPNSCQHCENPACMVDCPTGAIGRDPEGEVFIRDALCTGCGACAKACPWDNIQMAPRPAEAPRPAGGAASAYAELAVKCDLCRTYESGPACVQVCPTNSILRRNPAEDMAEVRAMLGGARRGATAPSGTSARAAIGGAAIAAIAIGVVGGTMQARGLWQPARGLGWAAGLAAAVGFAALLLYAVPKRAVRWWMRRKVPAARTEAQRDGERAPVVSRVAPHTTAHLAIGLVTAALAFAHAPWPPGARASAGGTLAMALFATSLAGIATALAYALLPPRLARIERTPALPEDFDGERRTLLDRLYREVSGRSDLVKKIFERILLPYAKSHTGPLLLLASGRRLRDEEAALRTRIDGVLEGRGAERLAGLAELVRIVVELRALPAQRLLQRALRVGLPVHVVTFAIATALLVLHIVQAVGR